MGINYSGYCIGGIMKAIDEFKNKGAKDAKNQKKCKAS